MKISKRGIQNDNQKMRKIIDVYIKSNELNDPVWDLMNDDDGGTHNNNGRKTPNSKHRAKHQLEDEEHSTSKELNGFTRKDAIDAGKTQLKTLNRLDVEMNEILTNILKEENRQKLLMSDLVKLVNKTSFAAVVGNDHVVSPGLYRSSELSGRSSLVDQGIQCDGKEDCGVITDMDEHPADNLGLAPLAPSHAKLSSGDQPYQLRKCMQSFPHVLRVPPAAWTCQSIMSIYLSKITADKQMAVLKKPKLPLAVYAYEYYLELYGLPLVADLQMALLMKACQCQTKIPRVSLFSSQIGLHDKDNAPPLDVRDTDFVLQVISHLMNEGEILPPGTPGAVVSMDGPHFRKDPSVQKNKTTGGSSQVTSYRPDIPRALALQTVKDIFCNWLADGGEDYLMKVRAMPHTERGTRFVDVDSFIDILMEPWFNVRHNWEEHAKYLFLGHCSTHKVLQDATFATDDGVNATDTIVVEVQKSSTKDSARRPLRSFTNPDFVDLPKGGNVIKEPVVELMCRNTFIDVMLIINPTISHREIDNIFDEALELQHSVAMRSLESLWLKCVDNMSHGALGGKGHGGKPSAGKDFYVNLRTLHTQWTRPYIPKMFRSQDIELDTFVAILVQRDVFAKSPMVHLLTLSPVELWPNADMFWKQIKEKQRRAATKVLSTPNIQLRSSPEKRVLKGKIGSSPAPGNLGDRSTLANTGGELSIPVTVTPFLAAGQEAHSFNDVAPS